jgi:hypothetical protein
VASPQLTSGPPSGRLHPGRPCDKDRIANGIASLDLPIASRFEAVRLILPKRIGAGQVG